MMQSSAEKNDASIEEAVRRLVASYCKGKDVHMDSEIYYELGIYGEDLFEIFESLIDKYGVDYSKINASEIAPGEGGALMGWVARRFGSPSFRSFKVRDLVNLTIEGLEVESGKTR